MNKSNDIRTGRHCVFNLHAHLVFVTKYRKKIFTNRVLTDMEETFQSVCNDFGASLIECNGEDDHVHLVVHYKPTTALSTLVNSLKGVSARMIRSKNYPEVRAALYGGHFWSPSYFAGSCGGAPLSVLHEYVKSQNRPQ
jgi:putative transposase